jgi:hypothetical protein
MLDAMMHYTQNFVYQFRATLFYSKDSKMANLSQPSQDLLKYYSERPDFIANVKYQSEPGYMQQYQDLLKGFAKGNSDVFKQAIKSAVNEGVIEEKRTGMYHLTQDGCDWIARNTN